jgi:hypothetical protein
MKLEIDFSKMDKRAIDIPAELKKAQQECVRYMKDHPEAKQAYAEVRTRLDGRVAVYRNRDGTLDIPDLETDAMGLTWLLNGDKDEPYAASENPNEDD